MLSAPSSPETWRMQRSRGYPKTGNLRPPITQLYKQPRWPLPPLGIVLRVHRGIIV